MEKTLTLQELVEEFGNEKQKEAFKLGNGNLNSRTLKSIVNNALRCYAKYEEIGRGRKRKIRLYEKYEIERVKEDKRISNGKWSNPYLRFLEILIIKKLEQGVFHEKDESPSYWFEYFDLVTKKEYNLFSSYKHNELYEPFINELIDNHILTIGEERVLKEFTNYYSKLKDQVIESLKRFAKINVLRITPYYNGILNNPQKVQNSKGDYETIKKIAISQEVYDEVKKIESELRSEFSINPLQIKNLPYMRKVIDYNEKRKKHVAEVKDDSGKKLNLDYVYVTYHVHAPPVDNLLQNYLESYKYLNDDVLLSEVSEHQFWENIRSLFLENRKFYIENDANKTTETFLERYSNLNEIKYDKEYFSLFFERNYTGRMNALSEYFIK